jgi:hypothetical protein
MKLTTAAVLVASQKQVSADLSSDGSGSVVILGLKDGMYFELNEVGARVWNLIQQPRTIRSVVEELLQEYDVAAEKCEADVLCLAEDMATRGLVDFDDSSTA